MSEPGVCARLRARRRQGSEPPHLSAVWVDFSFSRTKRRTTAAACQVGPNESIFGSTRGEEKTNRVAPRCRTGSARGAALGSQIRAASRSSTCRPDGETAIASPSASARACLRAADSHCHARKS